MRLLLVGETIGSNEFEVIKEGDRRDWMKPGVLKVEGAALSSWLPLLVERGNYVYIAAVGAAPRQAGFYQDATNERLGWVLLERRSSLAYEMLDTLRLRAFAGPPRSNPLPLDVVFGRPGAAVGAVSRALSTQFRRIPGVVVHEHGYTEDDARVFLRRATGEPDVENEHWLERQLADLLGLYHGWPTHADWDRFNSDQSPLLWLRRSTGWGIRRRSLVLSQAGEETMSPTMLNLLMTRAVKESEDEFDGDVSDQLDEALTALAETRSWQDFIRPLTRPVRVGKKKVSHHDLPRVIEAARHWTDTCRSFIPEFSAGGGHEDS